MADLKGLYQEAVLDHYKKPRNLRKIEHATRQAEGFNPLCGDRLVIYIKARNGVIEDIAFAGSGCAISTASASMMTESLKGKTEAEAEALFESFHQLVTNPAASQSGPESLGTLAVFAGLRGYPVRVKCAILAWHTMLAALRGSRETVATE